MRTTRGKRSTRDVGADHAFADAIVPEKSPADHPDLQRRCMGRPLWSGQNNVNAGPKSQGEAFCDFP